MAGDSKAAIDARAALLDAGVGRLPFLDALVAQVAVLDLGDAPVVVDLGCGSGDGLAAIAGQRPGTGIGTIFDRGRRRAGGAPFSGSHLGRRQRRPSPAAARCERRSRGVHSRPAQSGRDGARFRPRGHLLIAVPAADDLIELRELVQGQRVEQDRAEAVLAEQGPRFELIARSVTRETVELERTSLLDLLRGTHRGVRRAAAERAAALERMSVTMLFFR